MQLPIAPHNFISTLILAALSCTASGEIATNWPQFRGLGALGVSDNPHLPERWSTNENVAWKIEVPGRGSSSPIVWGERVFVTTVASEEEMEAPKKGLYFGGDRVTRDRHFPQNEAPITAVTGFTEPHSRYSILAKPASLRVL